MTAIVSKGWNLSHGWSSRPKAVQINKEVVDRNISKWVHRLSKKADNQRKLDIEDIDINAPDTRDGSIISFGAPTSPSHFDMTATLLRFYKNNCGGSQYSTRSTFGDAGRTNSLDHEDQHFDTTVRDIRLQPPVSPSADRYSYLGEETIDHTL